MADQIVAHWRRTRALSPDIGTLKLGLDSDIGIVPTKEPEGESENAE
jgi:hypothetical protein